MIRWSLKLAEFNIESEHRPGTQNTIADVLSRNSIENVIGEKVNCAIIRDLVLSSRDQLIEQKTDPKLGHIYSYLENPEDSSVNAAICENWSRDFRLVEGLLFYAKYATSLGEMRVYIPPKSLRNEIIREFHEKPLTGHFGRFKTYKIRDVCYFPYMRKFIDQYVSTWHICQINNYKNALPAGRLIPIVSNYPNEIVTLDLLCPYPVSRVRRNRYVLVITDHFSKWAEIIPLIKASARVTADNFFDNYISRFEAPINLISDNGPQFISDIFENLSERLGIRHVKTVVHRPQANRTERLNRDLVQVIANYVNEQHDTSDQFLREFAYAIRTAINETTRKTSAELFLGRKLITPFQKLVMVSDGTEFAVGDIERLFEEARQNTKTKHEKWEKYYNRRRRDVQIKVNDWVLVATHPLSSATRKVVAKFKPNLKVRIYRHRKCDEKEIGTGSSDNGSLRDESSDFDRVQRRSNESRDGKNKGSEVKRELEGKGLSVRNNQGGPERKVQKGPEHRKNKRNLSSNDSNSMLPKFRKKNRREETVTPITSGYNLRPRKGKRKESRPTIEKKTQQGGPVRSRKGRERNYSPYTKERTRSSYKNARRGGDQQRQDQERRGMCTKKSLSLEVLVGNANYKSEESGCIVSFYILSNKL
ncbi:transposon Tf2-6 polyprotein [Trichonephila clavipes]|nr:transposon Tf2-6 polyprotein [Trichonephila clavipes]